MGVAGLDEDAVAGLDDAVAGLDDACESVLSDRRATQAETEAMATIKMHPIQIQTHFLLDTNRPKHNGFSLALC